MNHLDPIQRPKGQSSKGEENAVHSYHCLGVNADLRVRCALEIWMCAGDAMFSQTKRADS